MGTTASGIASGLMKRTGLPEPFFERAPGAVCDRGRILLVTYHFPPSRAAGALRWQKMAGIAHELGWGLDVFCLDPAELDHRDDARLEDLPAGVRVFGVPKTSPWIERLESGLHAALRSIRPGARTTRDVKHSQAATPTPAATTRPSSFARTEVAFDAFEPRSWLRAYWSWLDFKKGSDWANRAHGFARRIFEPSQHRLILTCGPPHMVHDAGRRLARETKLPWVMDLRDPWSRSDRTPEVFGSPLWFSLARRWERRCLRSARLIVMNTEPARDVMAEAYPSRAADVIAVPNAFDENPVPDVKRSARFLVAYAGTVYLDRTPETLFRAAARVVREENLRPEEFGIEFMGHLGSIDGTSINELAARAGLARDYLRLHPPSDYAVAERFLADASLLVSLPQDSHLAIPSKVFDYMRYEARLLILAEAGSATELLLRGTSAEVVDPRDENGMAEALRRALRERRRGEIPEPIAADARFSRRSRTRELFEAIELRLGDL